MSLVVWCCSTMDRRRMSAFDYSRNGLTIGPGYWAETRPRDPATARVDLLMGLDSKRLNEQGCYVHVLWTGGIRLIFSISWV